MLITGAEGRIGSILRERLADRYELRSLTRARADFPSHVADITDLDRILPAFEGVDAVVHLAGAASVEAPWEDVLESNLVGTRNVFEAARRCRLERVVYASTNHTVGRFELDGAPGIYELDDPRTVDELAEPRPDSLYGVSKVFGEALGRYYAEAHGLRVLCVRIGSVLAVDDPCATADPPRYRATWLSHRDCAQLVARCLDADVSWAVVYGTSANPRLLWSLEGARALGYAPEDAAPVDCG